MLHKHDPIDEKEMTWISDKYTICQVLREIYWKTDDPEIKLNCRIAMTMAKRITRKLTEYKKGWDEGFFDKNPNFFKYIKNSNFIKYIKSRGDKDA